jgi:predicted NodU family carbamoyl transferase
MVPIVFKVNSGEYMVMGLAPYGRPRYVQAIYDHLLELKADGTFRLNMEYFNYRTGLTMTDGKIRRPVRRSAAKAGESALSQREMDLARSVQDVTEEVMLRLARTVHAETGVRNLCLAGGVALNCVANGKVLQEGALDPLSWTSSERWIRCPACRKMPEAGAPAGSSLRSSKKGPSGWFWTKARPSAPSSASWI